MYRITIRKIYTHALFILVSAALLIISCKKNIVFNDISESNIPVVSTVVKDIYQTSALAYGNISDIGGSEVIQRGVCYDTQATPTINTNKILSDSLSSDFSVKLTKLSPATTYYVRAFATNSDGTGYGESIQFTTKAKAAPEITTNKTIEITQNTAKSGGTIISDGGDAITISGVCWNFISEPTISNVKSTDGSSIGSFSSIVNGLKANTTYYVRSYATNSIGTGYGIQDTFKTSAIPTAPVLTTTNMSSVTQTTAVGGGTIISNGGSDITGCGICYSINKVPTTAGDMVTGTLSGDVFTCDISNLNPGITYYVRAYAINSVGTNYGEEIQFTTGINIPELTTTNVSSLGYNVATSGGTISSNGGNAISSCGICYSSIKNGSKSGIKIAGMLSGNSFSCGMKELYANTTYYVCAYAINNAGTGYGEEVSFTTKSAPEFPTVTTSAVSNVTDVSATMGGEVTATGGADVTERGVCYATNTQTPTTSNSKKIIGSGVGIFSTTLGELACRTEYYVRAYAINERGTSYGSTYSFTTDSTIKDIENNVYKIVKIGTQVWMAENLKTTKFNDNTNIPLVNDDMVWAQLSTPGYCYYNKDEDYSYYSYGALYNWYTINTGKLCPTGWHVPSDAEWTIMEDYLIANGYNYDGTTSGNKIAKSLAATSNYWTSTTNTGAVGNTDYPAYQNKTGFTALPAGYRYSDGLFFDIGYNGSWWSSTEYDIYNAWNRGINGYLSNFPGGNSNKEFGISVRCVRN